MRKPSDNLDTALDDWSVHDPEMWHNEDGPKGWYAVSNETDGIVAYFLTEKDAFRWRLDMVNRDLNP